MPDGPDGKTYELYTPPGWNDVADDEGFFMNTAYTYGWFSDPWARLSVFWPAHYEPFESIAEQAIDSWDDLDPDPYTMTEYGTEYIGEAELERSREEPPPTSGAWQINEIVGTEGVSLTPNEHYRHADRINFDEIFLEWSEEEVRTVANLHAGHMDYASVEVDPGTAEEFPDAYEERVTPTGHGLVISLNHNSPFGDVRVRRALAYAIDTPDIAQNVHATLYEPITVPGGEMWQIGQVLDENWIEENLEDYSQDLDRATELMQEAGFERNEDDVWEREGK